VTSSDRITIPAALAADPLGDDGEQDAPSSDVRQLLPRYAVPWLVATYEELQKLTLGAHGGFVVSLIDGRASIEMIVGLSAMPEAETLAILARLLRVGAIELHDPE
jgi:hypothetical protein